jgi:16S rRNA (cytosine1402-N4)-methyltransferase
MLAIQKTDTVVDATLGGAGHAREIAAVLGHEGFFIGFDLDSDAIDRAEAALSDASTRKLFINANFRTMKKELEDRGVTQIDKALFDLGWSATQLEAGRGFSFLSDEPLLMTYAKTPKEHALTAATIVNEWAESSLSDIIFGWGEERYSRRIARMIVERRQRKSFSTASELAEAIREAVPPAARRGRLHPATKTFQALRIAVNDEMGALKDGLMGARAMLTPGGRIAVITFHSIEDRAVKHLFADWEKEGKGQRLTKKPIAPTPEELKENPRARSAKLRVFQTVLKHS